MTDQARTEKLRLVSKQAFGQEHRLELMLAIAEEEEGFCTLTELTDRLGVRMSSLQRPFRSLITLGLLSPVPGVESRYRYYVANRSAAWDWALELARAVVERTVDDDAIASTS